MISHMINIFAESCTIKGGAFLTLPHWYQYLKGSLDSGSNVCVPVVGSLSDIWLILLAVIDMLLQLVAFITIIIVIYGGVQMISSQGQPDRVAKARTTIINALVGAAISISAAGLVSFLAGQL